MIRLGPARDQRSLLMQRREDHMGNVAVAFQRSAAGGLVHQVGGDE